jgi:hypothetical protein
MATPSTVFLSGTNGFVPRATGQAISYIREESDFPLMDYCQTIESPGTQAYYFIIDRDTPVRVVTDSEYAFADGSERPVTNFGGLQFAMVPFVVERRNYGTYLGHQAIAMAKDQWKPLEHTVGAQISIAMTNRTNRVAKLLENPANWGSNTGDVNTITGGGGTWDKASGTEGAPNYNCIKNSLFFALDQITQQTNAQVKQQDLVLKLVPTLAWAMANSSEIHAYLKNGVYSLPNLEGEKKFREKWGLPKYLYGFEVIIEDSVIVTDRPQPGVGAGTNVSTTRSYIGDSTKAQLMSRKGGIEGTYGSPSFSTLQLYWYEYMAAVYVWTEERNAREIVDVTDQFQEILAAPESGFLFTGCR